MAIVTGDRYLESLVRFVERNAGPLLEGTLTLKLNPGGLRYVQSRLETLEELEVLLAGAPVDYLRAYVYDLGDHRALEQLRRIFRLLTSLKVISVLPPPARDPTPLSLLTFGRVKVLELRGCDLSSSTARGLLELRHTLERLICHNSTVLCPIIKLVLRNNALTTLRGIENLKSVEGLDLSYNILSTFSELDILASLPSLQSVWLEGNPICCARWYRAHVFSFFPHPEKVKLDEKGISTREYWERYVVLASRHKRPAGYGFYFPAKDNAKDYGHVNTKKKKASRLASIEDDEQRYYFAPENVDRELASCDSDNLRKDETVITDNKAEITDLMNNVEFMKKEHPVLWLQHFREWMDQRAVDALNIGKCMESNFDPGTGKYTKQRKGEKHLARCPVHLDSLLTSKGECSINLLETDIPFSDTSAGIHQQQLSCSNEKSVLKNPAVDKVGSRMGRVDLGQDQLELCCKALPDSVPSEKNNSFFSTNLMFEGGKETEGRKSSESFTAIQEIMGSHQSSLNPGSPPHYQEDILHCRQHMEDEILELSAESYSVASSDGDTSFSDDDSCKFRNSFLGSDHLLDKDFMKRSISDHPSEFQLKYDPQDARERDSLQVLSGASVEPYSCIQQLSMPNNDEPFRPCDMDDPSADSVKIIGENAEDRRKGKWKPRRRVVALLEVDSLAESKGLMYKGSNGILEAHKIDIEDGFELPSCNENHLDKLQDEELVCNPDMNNVRLNSVHSAALKAMPGSLGAADVHIEKYFLMNLANAGVSESCEEFICCDCILGEGSGYQEREVAVLLSNKQKVYVLLMNMRCEGPGLISKVLGCHRLEEIKEVVIGLQLQTLRVQVDGDVSYLFLLRSAKKLESLLYLLRICDSNGTDSVCSIKSWDQVQSELFDKHICGGQKMSIFLYSMMLFWHENCEGDSWLSRSLFLVEGYVVVCFENLVQFGKSTDDIDMSTPYFSLDSCCPIENISEMVIEPKETRCLTLTLDHDMSGNNCIINKCERGQSAEKTVQVLTWRLKWFSEERLLKFVALLKAIHAGLAMSPQHVECIS